METSILQTFEEVPLHQAGLGTEVPMSFQNPSSVGFMRETHQIS